MDFCVPYSFISFCERRERNVFSTPFRTRSNSDSRAVDAARSTVYKRDLLGHYGCVNAIEFSSNGRLIASGGDDKRLLIWNLWKTILEDSAPLSIDTPHISNINSCCFDNVDKKVATGGNDGQVIVHDIDVLKSTSVYGLSDAVYCISPDPINSTILATASDEGKVQILDTRTSDDSSPVTLADTGGSMHSVMYNSAEPRILATANSKHGIAIWDIRMPLKSLSYKSNIHNCMSVRFNSRGDKILALRRRAPPVLYDIAQTQPLYQFDHDTYYNACTLKSGCFAGLHDEFVVSGSDDFCVYLWKIPDTPNAAFTQTEPYVIMRGHRSIVNQVRFCHHNQMIISSGVEKLIKIWSPYPTPYSNEEPTYSRLCLNNDEDERNAYSHEEYIHMVLRAGSFLSHDYSNGNTDEEPCMIAFFDSLIQREVEQSMSESEKQSSADSHSSVEDGPGERLMDQTDNSLMFGVEDNEEGSGRSRVLDERRLAQGTTSVGNLDSENHSRSGNSSSRFEEISRLSYMEYESSSDSGSEVDEILSAMYNRYMHSREQLESQGPTGKKISSVIAQGKYKDKKSRGHGHQCRQRLQYIGENLQHSDDQYLRDNARNLSILADVIDNFVDNLVASDSSTSRSLTDANNGGVTNSVASDSTNMQAAASGQSRNVQQQGDGREGNSSTQPRQQNLSLSRSSRVTPNLSQEPGQSTDLEPGRYFIPELEVFAPRSLQAVLNQEQHRSSTHVPRPDTGQLGSISSLSDNTRVMENGNTRVMENGCGSTKQTQSRVMNGDDGSRNGVHPCPSREDSTPLPQTDTNNFRCSADSTELQNNGVNYASRKISSKKQNRAGNSAVKRLSSSKSSYPSSSFSETLSSSSSSTFNFSSASSSSSSTPASTVPPVIPYCHKSVKSSLLSPKLKLSKAKEDLNGKQNFPIKETGAYSSKDCAIDSKDSTTFKKISKSKKRRFRLHKIGDSCSSSEEETL